MAALPFGLVLDGGFGLLPALSARCGGSGSLMATLEWHWASMPATCLTMLFAAPLLDWPQGPGEGRAGQCERRVRDPPDRSFRAAISRCWPDGSGALRRTPISLVWRAQHGQAARPSPQWRSAWSRGWWRPRSARRLEPSAVFVYAGWLHRVSSPLVGYAITRRPINSRADDGRNAPPSPSGRRCPPKATTDGVGRCRFRRGRHFRLARAQGASPRTLIRRASAPPSPGREKEFVP